MIREFQGVHRIPKAIMIFVIAHAASGMKPTVVGRMVTSVISTGSAGKVSHASTIR